MSTPQEIDNERIRIMAEVYESTAGYQQIIRRAKFFAELIERKKLYIDENHIVGSMASTVNGIYTYPEWNVEWMKEEKTVENSKTPEDRKANQWALEYWDKWALRPRADEIFIKKYGYDPAPVYQAGLVAEFMSWPGGGGNLNYPRVYNEGLASMIKEVEERQMALDMRLPNAPNFYFYEACLITMKAIIRLAHRYAELARELAAKEKNHERKQELLDIAEVCQHVPEHPARNLREAIQCHFLCHICAEIEQVGCGYSEAYLGQNFEPFYQRDKAAGLIGPEEATYLLKLLFIKLNEIGYYYGQKVAIQNSADLGQSITLGGFTEDGDDATAEMDYLILDAAKYLKLPQPPLSCCYTEKMSGRFLEKVLNVIDTGVGMPQFVNGNVMVKRALNLFANSKKGVTLEKARRTCVGACVGSYIPYETGHPVEGQPNLGKVLELTLNDGFDPRTKVQLGPKTGNPETFKDFEELYAAFEKQLQFCEDTLRKEAWIASILCAEYLPVTWRLHPDEGVHRDRNRGLERRGQLLHGGPDRRRWRGRGERAVRREAPRVRHEEADDGRAEEGAGGRLQRRVREGSQAVLRGPQARKRHPGGQPVRAPCVQLDLPGLPERGRRRQLHQQGHPVGAGRLHEEHPQPDGSRDGSSADRKEGGSGAHRWLPLGHAGNRCQRSDGAGHVRGEKHGCHQVHRDAHEHEAPAEPAQDPQGSGVRAEPHQGLHGQRRLPHSVQRAGHQHPEGCTEAPGEVPRSRCPGGRLQRLLDPAAQGRAGRDHRPHRAEFRSVLKYNGTGTALRHAVPAFLHQHYNVAGCTLVGAERERFS